MPLPGETIKENFARIATQFPDNEVHRLDPAEPSPHYSRLIDVKDKGVAS
jgi:hypothetical protein